MTTSGWPARSSACRITPTWPSIIPLGPTTCAPATACATAMDAYRSRVTSLSTSPASVSGPQWPWSVYSHRHRSAISTVASPTSVARSASACWTIPSGSSAAEPRASLTAGMPNSIIPPTPASTASAAALRRLSLVCWVTPGMDGTGSGSLIPSLTNRGSTRSDPRTVVRAASRRSAAVRRSLRGRAAGNPSFTAGSFPLTGISGWFPARRTAAGERSAVSSSSPGTPSSALPRTNNDVHPPGGRWRRQTSTGHVLASPQAAPGAAPALAGLAYRLTGGDGRIAEAGAVAGQRLGQGHRRGLRRHHVHPQPVLGGGLRGLRADHRDGRDRVRLAGDADQVPHGRRGGEQDRVEPAALDRLPDRRWRRGGPHRAVGGDVLGLPAQAGQPGDQCLGGGVVPGQQHPVDWIEHVVVGRPGRRQPLAGLLPLGHEVGLDAEPAERGGGLLTDRRHL